MAEETIDLNTSKIKDWRSIVTLVVFVLTNLVVLFPFHIPIPVPRLLWRGILSALARMRVIPPKKRTRRGLKQGKDGNFVLFRLPINFVTAPLIADLFLLAILAIGRQEVHDGTIGANNISPLDIMLFFLSLAYIAISIDASGLIRWLAFKVLQWGGDVGHRLFFYLYAFFFALTSFIGNDPVILSGTAFLAYMTRVSSNIVHPRAWIYSQFAVANIASAILVSSNPTNLVIAGAFSIKFIRYTANIIVPVVVTGIVLFPFLLYIVFAEESLIPLHIEMHELPEEARGRAPRNPNIPNRMKEDANEASDTEEGKLMPLEEIMNPFLDKAGAAFGGIIMAATLITLLAINAAAESSGKHHVFWVTLPAAFVALCFDLAWGWIHRHETRRIAFEGREEGRVVRSAESTPEIAPQQEEADAITSDGLHHRHSNTGNSTTKVGNEDVEMQQLSSNDKLPEMGQDTKQETLPSNFEETTEARNTLLPKHRNLVSITEDAYRWCQETFPTATTVLAHLPFALVPFAFCMFVLVQGLVNKGWVSVFAYGWDHWVTKTGTVGAVGGMGFVSVILCNFAGTNIGTSILISRVLQAWQEIHRQNGIPISDRTFWATIYSLALGVNYGAFSAAFSASLAGLLWRDILGRKHIKVRSLDFARVNLPIIAIAMVVGCSVLLGEVYIVRNTEPYV
ncbi:hypothetical protein BDV96DRAFT_608729 [Lophiotrema nucula]|uniref:Citrate transporter-like domain-containing protein n=1 Tax=Lophiotrema nucula TaxID=690887 RepID=A0A6A5ZX87_9PLEO|nr:hypothetical protein BDV96DRAFT_608729 [Lophiotrema nucula]